MSTGQPFSPVESLFPPVSPTAWHWTSSLAHPLSTFIVFIAFQLGVGGGVGGSGANRIRNTGKLAWIEFLKFRRMSSLLENNEWGPCSQDQRKIDHCALHIFRIFFKSSNNMVNIRLTTPAAKLPPVPMTPVAICHQYQRHRRQICHWWNNGNHFRLLSDLLKVEL